MLNRSVERDYDIAYHTRAAHRAMDDLEQHIATLLAVFHDPHALMISLDEQWRTLKEELNFTSS